MFASSEDFKRPRKGALDGASSSRACSSFHDAEYGATNSRDSLAETFVSSFLNLKHEVAGAVEKGLSSSFALDAFLRGCQTKIDQILEDLRTSPEDDYKNTLVLELNRQFEEMCQAQMRTNQKWQGVNVDLARSVGETDAHWKRAEVFFRSKQKRGETRTVVPVDARNKVARRPVGNGFPEPPKSSLTLVSRGARPSLIPNRAGGANGLPRKQKITVPDNAVDDRRRRSSTPEKKPKLSAAKKWAKRMEILKNKEMRLKEKEKKRLASPAKKRRPIAQRALKRPIKEETDFSSDESKDSSDPPYTSSETSRNIRNASEEREKANGAKKKKTEPEEQKYCTCRNFSFGNMVGCDNDGCVIEWFHFECVGLKAKPRGKWYCPTCRDGDNCKVLKVLPPGLASQLMAGTVA